MRGHCRDPAPGRGLLRQVADYSAVVNALRLPGDERSSWHFVAISQAKLRVYMRRVNFFTVSEPVALEAALFSFNLVHFQFRDTTSHGIVSYPSRRQ